MNDSFKDYIKKFFKKIAAFCGVALQNSYNYCRMIGPFLKNVYVELCISWKMLVILLKHSRFYEHLNALYQDAFFQTYFARPAYNIFQTSCSFYRKKRELFLTEWHFTSPFYEKANPPQPIKIVFWGASSFFILFIAWATFFKIDEFVHAPGDVETNLEEKVMRHFEGGVIDTIFVKEGQYVSKGDVLLTLKDDPIKVSKEDNTEKYYNQLGHVARLKAQLEEQSELILPKEIIKYSKTLAKEIQDAFASSMISLKNQKKIYEKQQAAKELELKEMIEREKNLKEVVNLAQKEVDFLEPLTKQKLVPKTQLMRSQKDLLDKKTQHKTALLSVPKIKSEIEEIQKRLEQVVYDFQQKVLDELKQREPEIGTSKVRLETDQDRFERSRLRSPIQGIIKTLHIKTNGSALPAGQDAVTIVPFEDQLVVTSHVNPKDVGFVSLGNKASVKITAFDYSIFGSLDGHVTHISPDTFLDDKKQPYFKIKVRCAKNYFLHQGKKFFISPGMTSQVDILTGKKSVMHYLLKPIVKTFSEALTEK